MSGLRQLLPFIGAFLLTLLIGMLVGSVVTVRLRPPRESLTLSSASSTPTIPVVTIGRLGNDVRGQITGTVRMFAGSHEIIPDASGSFRIILPTWSTDVTVTVPSGMRFVASRKGKHYYPVLSTAGERIAPERRIYFATEAEARAAGYSAGK
ncbi:hypothetical protein HY285_02200 [Candidatus Peregrinibacteria bacterium]|nr:hypothetical protein [Candidatus Peregrinibacteria bacterium]MBI3816335.1 hypothetical protein [Candidatus Peregrinibacteria bacterium]